MTNNTDLSAATTAGSEYHHVMTVKDGGGAGTFVGGAGAEAALALHDAPEGKIKIIAFGVAGLRNSGQGLFGGYPAAPSLLMLLEDSKLADLIAQRKYPSDMTDLGGHSRLLPYSELELRKDDVLYIRAASGGGYGDPLEREPRLVSEDVRNGLVSRETAEQVYGVVMDESAQTADLSKTQELRIQLRQQRTVQAR